MMPRRVRLLAAALALVCAPAVAQTYRVDVIVFRDLWARSPEPPRPPAESPVADDLPDPAAQTLSLLGITPSAEREGFDLRGALTPDEASRGRLAAYGIEVLPEAQFGLQQQWNRLRNSQQFRPLLRLSWLQRDPPPEGGPRLRLASDEEDEAAVAHDGGVALQREVDGSVVLNAGRLLHVGADLLYTDTAARPPFSQRLAERRRVRKGELHHLDGGQLGLLVRVTDPEDGDDAPAP